MAAFPVVLDACVLLNAPVQDTLLRAAEHGLYRVHWSQKNLDETTKNQPPSANWRKLQDDVRDILRGCGFKSESNQPIKTACCDVNVDVFGLDNSQLSVRIYRLVHNRFWLRVVHV